VSNAQLSVLSMIFFILCISTCLIFLSMHKDSLLKIEQEQYLMEYNQQLLLVTLNYSIYDNLTIIDLIQAKECGRDNNVSRIIKSVLNNITKKEYDYLFRVNDWYVNSTSFGVNLTSIQPATLNFTNYCNKNVIIQVGMFREE